MTELERMWDEINELKEAIRVRDEKINFLLMTVDNLADAIREQRSDMSAIETDLEQLFEGR